MHFWNNRLAALLGTVILYLLLISPGATLATQERTATADRVVTLESATELERATAPEGVVPPKWQLQLPTTTCPNGDRNCLRASPALADVNNDGRDDIILATYSGHVIALRDDGSSDGQVLWNVDIGTYIPGVGTDNARISSSPAVADIDRNDGGRPEIVIGYGFELGSDTRGGVIVLEHTGAVKNNWPRPSIGTHPNGNPKSVFSTPALGDLDGDTDLEIVVAGLDGAIYAYQHTGALLPGFPPNSYLAQRFPDWDHLQGHLADSIWSSPALGDLNGDGQLEIVLGTDEGNFDSRWGGNANGWTCPYALPPGWAPGYCGGSLYALNAGGQVMPGFPHYFLEIIQSSPALADIDQDGRDEIFFGTGAFYWLYSSDHPTFGFRVYGFNSDGTPLPGWAGGKAVGGVTPASPTIGDITGDGESEVIFGAFDGKIYAYHLNGQSVAGFPMTPKARYGTTQPIDVGKTLVLADYDSDGKMEIFVNIADSVVIVDGNGNQLTSISNGGDGKPAFGTGGGLINNPAVGDIDGDGRLELVVHDSDLFVWDLTSNQLDSAWPVWQRNAARTSRVAAVGFLDVTPSAAGTMCQTGQACSAASAIGAENGGDQPLLWSFNTGNTSSRVSFQQTSGTIPANGGMQAPFSVNTGGLGDGFHDLGSVTLNASSESGVPAGSATIDIFFYRGQVYDTFLPLSPEQ